MFRSVAEFKKTADPTPAEVRLIAACRAGEDCKLGDGNLPDEGADGPERRIRASLIRLLAMGGTPDCMLHRSGVALVGARITGELDLRFATAQGRLKLDACRFEMMPRLEQAQLDQLSLEDSHFPGLFAEGVKIKGDMYLRRSTSTAMVNLMGAEITGALTCEVANLDGGTGMALSLQGAKVGDGFFFRKVVSVKGLVDLNTAHFSDLVDDAPSWGKCMEGWKLSGLTYDRIAGFGPKTFAGRRDWLEKGSLVKLVPDETAPAGVAPQVKTEFRPQPYTQLARVFAASGDMSEARKVLFAREKALAGYFRFRRYLRPNPRFVLAPENLAADFMFVLRWGWDLSLRLFAGYGYDPKRALFWMAGLVGIAIGLAHMTWVSGAFAPNSDVVLVSHGWRSLLTYDCLDDGPDDPAPVPCVKNPALAWSNDPLNGLDWDSFSAVGYAVDLVVPVLDLGQTDAWAPSKDRSSWGHAFWWARWVLAGMGWLVTALGAAAVTGIIQRGNPD